MKVREYETVRLDFTPPSSLKWAFRRISGDLYQVRGVGRVHNLEIEPRWGWDMVHEMVDRVLNLGVEGGGLVGIPKGLGERFKREVERFRRESFAYREGVNLRGEGKLLPHLYDPTRPLDMPALQHTPGESPEYMWLNYVLHLIGYDVDEYEPVEAEVLRLKMLEDKREVWRLAYLIVSGVVGKGDRGFLLNTPFLFEEYVGKVYSGRRWGGVGGGLKPDFVIRGNVPLDAKYKVKVQPCDVYQAFTYAAVLRSGESVLVYPKVERKTLRIGDVRVRVESLR